MHRAFSLGPLGAQIRCCSLPLTESRRSQQSCRCCCRKALSRPEKTKPFGTLVKDTKKTLLGGLSRWRGDHCRRVGGPAVGREMGLNSEYNKEGGGVSGARKGLRGSTRVRGLRLNPPTRILAEPGQGQACWGELRGPGRSGQSQGTSPAPRCRMDVDCAPHPHQGGPRVQRSQPPDWTRRGAGRRLRSSRLSPPRRPAAGSAGEGQGGRLPARQPTTGPGSPSGGGRPPLGAGPRSFPTG